MARLTLLVMLFWLSQGRTVAQSPKGAVAEHDSSQTAPRQREEGNIQTVDFTVNAITFAKSRFPNLRGQGITICQKENAPDSTDIDLRQRLRPSTLTSAVVTTHATEMATIMAGAGNFSLLSQGVAPKAGLISVDFTSLLPESDAFYRSNHVTVVNHSYGTDIENFYGPEAVAYDASIHRSPTVLHVFSAGNLGYASSPTGPYANLPTVATLTGNVKMAKNSLVVGAVDATGVLVASSSRGPACDGRLKPELVAYSDDGSSGSAALASGIAALLQQAMQQQTGTDPNAALIKAVLINSADDVNTPGIDFQTGYGNINAFAAITTVANRQYRQADVAGGSMYATTIQVPVARRLKITLAWTDPPAVLNQSKVLVNDLDLSVFDGKSIWLPWVLNPSPNLDSLQKLPVRMRDTLNNVEQITIDLPSAGTYTIRVRGSRIGAEQQPFAIAYQWDTPGTFMWMTPSANAYVESDRAVTLRWKNTTAADFGTLEYSPDQGKSWAVAGKQIPLASGMFSWKTPALFTTGQLRMRLTDSVYTSSLFTLSPIPTPTVSFACADSMGINWVTETGGQLVTQHYLYRIGAQADAWENVGMLTGNQAVITGIRPGDQWAIAPVLPTREPGIRSEPFDNRQVACYYRTLTATLIDSLIEVQCELSISGAIESITFQKQTPQGVLTLATQSVKADSLFYTLNDTFLTEGPNTYRVRLLMRSGAVIYSDYVTAFVIRKMPVLLYPNPVTSGLVVTAQMGKYGPYLLRLSDETGRFVRDYLLSGTEGELATTGLPAGVYTYAVFLADRRIQTGKLLIR